MIGLCIVTCDCQCHLHRPPSPWRSPWQCLSLLVILLCICLDLRLAISMDSDQATVARYVCMGCQGQVSYFSTYKAAACHFANSPTCNQSGRSIRVVTIQARPGDRDAGGSGAAGTWEPRNTAARGANMLYNMLYNTLLHSVWWYITPCYIAYGCYITGC